MISMNKRYGKSRLVMLPPISHQPKADEEEKRLLLQVQKIDAILKSDNLRTLHGLIFTDTLKNRLADDLLACINKKHRLISFGFDLSGQSSEKIKAPLYMSSFKKKLEEMSVLNIEKFDSQNCKLREGRDWKVTLNQTKTSHKKRDPLKISSRKMSNLSTIKNGTHSTSTTPQKIKQRRKIKVITEPEEEEQSSPKGELTLQKIERMLSTVKTNLVTLWLPPKSYPQFYGIIVPSIAITKSDGIRCRIKKYILFKQSLNSRLFEALLEYLSQKYGVYIDRIEMIVNRQDYRGYFQGINCKIQSWQGYDKVSISYTRQVPS